MYEDAYDLTEAEKLQVQEILGEMALRGGRLADPKGRPVAYRILRSRRFLVCDKGLVWRFAPEGSAKRPGHPDAVPRRNSAVEMWTGKWRRVTAPDGRDVHAKCLVWVPLDENINGHSGISKLGWYQAEKGFRHPLTGPDAPDEGERAALEDERTGTASAVDARMGAEGLADPKDTGGPPADKPRRGRRADRSAS
jgi:hypothetical protein